MTLSDDTSVALHAHTPSTALDFLQISVVTFASLLDDERAKKAKEGKELFPSADWLWTDTLCS